MKAERRIHIVAPLSCYRSGTLLASMADHVALRGTSPLSEIVRRAQLFLSVSPVRLLGLSVR